MQYEATNPEQLAEKQRAVSLARDAARRWTGKLLTRACSLMEPKLTRPQQIMLNWFCPTVLRRLTWTPQRLAKRSVFRIRLSMIYLLIDWFFLGAIISAAIHCILTVLHARLEYTMLFHELYYVNSSRCQILWRKKRPGKAMMS